MLMNTEQKMPTGTITFATAPVTKKERMDVYVRGLLNGGSSVADMSGEYLPVLGFWNGKEYVRATNEDKSAITKDSIKQVRIDMPPDERGVVEQRYYRQVAQDGGENVAGLKVTAWERIDAAGKPVFEDKDGNVTTQQKGGKRVVTMTFTGFLDPFTDTAALHKGVQNELNPQTRVTVAFTKLVVDKMNASAGEGNFVIETHSHSFGSVNARTARATAELLGVPSRSRAIYYDAGLIGDAQSDLLRQGMNDPASPIYKQMQAVLGKDRASPATLYAASERLNDNTLLIVPIEKDEQGKWHSSNVARAKPGMEGILPGIGSWSPGAQDLLANKFLGYDPALEASTGKYGDVVFERIARVPNYTSSSLFHKVDHTHTEIPGIYAAANPDNFVTATKKPNGKAPPTMDEFWDDFAKFSSVPMTAVVKSAGGDGKKVMDSAVAAQKGDYLKNATDVFKAILSVFKQDDGTQHTHQSTPAADAHSVPKPAVKLPPRL